MLRIARTKPASLFRLMGDFGHAGPVIVLSWRARIEVGIPHFDHGPFRIRFEWT